ncbi:hypothetical protein COT30_05410 [Candidatus Micrarchaeota archaeon CG08_land_8_20_14_0_20_49_17]|nr:MAG: hypothetical protein COT30_05410 [Candidatus Micrarchaeota archaeon CG08_land_8_20_14_0_20_49_17]PIU81189.1 MAG: hypothetical protein COS70_05375 [Candidatus Micrarchaeota archaeon CG06_land_8_20_14_3_00_50_6]PIZ95525.1 MAG: hypothetical protein COX84_04450 [Candidatus Micrarchaeota archaeon CG_4_10_14_0_2_um_filter_49_7]HII53903.1 ArgE/DapE family deacylase [Candidatus Micrarchaeota archaeon]
MNLLNFLKELVAIDTSSPKNYQKCADLIAKEAESLGLKVNVISPTGKDGLPRPNAIISYEVGAKKTLILNAHYDTVPAGEGWVTDPFELIVKEEKAFGRGAGDDKGGIAVGMAILERLKERKIKNMNAILLCTCDEEVGSELGLKYIIWEKLVTGDLGIVLDGSADRIEIGSCCSVLGSIEIEGEQAHSSLDGYNVIGESLDFLRELQDYAKAREKCISKLRAPSGSKHEFVWGRFNITMLNGGIIENVMPPSLRVGFDLRIAPDEDEKKVIGEFETLAKGLLKKYKLKGKLNYKLHSGYFIDEKNVTAKRLAMSYEKVFGKKAPICSSLGGTDGSYLSKAVPCVVFAPGAKNMHGPNEYVETGNMEKCIETIVGMVGDWK